MLVVGGVLAARDGGSQHGPTKRGRLTSGVGGPAAGTARAQRTAMPATLRRFAAIRLPIYCGGGRRREVALTFDDGPGTYTKLALDQIRRARIRVTWFFVGRNIAGRQRTLAQEVSVGELGNHTWSHPLLPSLSEGEVGSEIARTQSAVASAVGTEPQLFRPPYAARNPAIDRQAQQFGLVQVLWNVDSEDSAGADKHGIARNVIAGLQPGSIVLMHENRGQTIQALHRILPALRRRRLRAVTVSELLAGDPPSDAQLQAGPRGCRLYGATGTGLRAGAKVG
jgi:peptidoglycan/xylan/chitin deacetylase (PgdA/CDA1 family)